MYFRENSIYRKPSGNFRQSFFKNHYPERGLLSEKRTNLPGLHREYLSLDFSPSLTLGRLFSTPCDT